MTISSPPLNSPLDDDALPYRGDALGGVRSAGTLSARRRRTGRSFVGKLRLYHCEIPRAVWRPFIRHRHPLLRSAPTCSPPSAGPGPPRPVPRQQPARPADSPPSAAHHSRMAARPRGAARPSATTKRGRIQCSTCPTAGSFRRLRRHQTDVDIACVIVRADAPRGTRLRARPRSPIASPTARGGPDCTAGRMQPFPDVCSNLTRHSPDAS